MYTASDLRKGLRIMLDDDPYIVVDFQFVKPGKGQSLYRCKLRNLLAGTIVGGPSAPVGRRRSRLASWRCAAPCTPARWSCPMC